MFIGAFNKKNNFCEREWAYEKWGLEYAFDAQVFGDVAHKITRLLGDKTTYTVQDAYKYFHLTYNAYQIDYKQFYNYCHTDAPKLFDISQPTISDDRDIELLAEDSGKYFRYLKNGNYTDERALTLVIDNASLREMTDTNSQDNLILAIGTFDDVTINSMKVILSPNVPEIEYALEFFRQHS